MFDHEVTMVGKLLYETASHKDGEKHAPTPSKMTWADIRSTTLGERFKVALEKLERLCYVIYGARPLQYDPYIDWKHRLNPRCLWQPEQFEQVNATPEEDCDFYSIRHWEYGTLGENKSGTATPNVPIRSRSGDPKLQFMDDVSRSHNRLYFPIGSVERSGDQVFYGNSSYDPRGTGDFGGDPDKIGTDGDIHIDGDDVVITWTPPALIAGNLNWAKVHYNGAVVDMTDASDGTLEAVIPAQEHNTLVRWYIEANFTTVEEGNFSVCDPGGSVAPALAKQYSYYAFSHWNPYPHGLPELWSYCKKGTDGYEFTSEETIQPALINLCRFILNYIGTRFLHSPKLRPDSPDCCLNSYIKFRWSGSAPWPHYVSGGKDPTDFVSPLHDRSDPGNASELARKSWRGVGNWFGDHEFGRGASWEMIPEELEQVHWTEAYPLIDCDIYFTGDESGLQEGDVIHREHIEEIISAVDYLIDNGLWKKCAIKRRMVTPDWAIADGKGCEWGDKYTEVGDCDDPTTGSTVGYGPCSIRVADVVDYVWWSPYDIFGEPDGKRQVDGLENWYIDCTEAGATDKANLTCKHHWEPAGGTERDFCYQYKSGGSNGWAAYVCGPIQCPNGCDAKHGNDLFFRRYIGAGVTLTETFAAFSNGNCFGEVFTCGVLHPAFDSHVGSFAPTVDLVWFQGFGDNWVNYDCGLTIEECSTCSTNVPTYNSGTIPELPGFPGHRSQDGEFDICTYENWEYGDEVYHFAECEVSVHECSEDFEYCAIDLNLSDGYPTLVAYETDPGDDYKDSGYYWTDCPCETWSSEMNDSTAPWDQWAGDGSCE